MKKSSKPNDINIVPEQQIRRVSLPIPKSEVVDPVEKKEPPLIVETVIKQKSSQEKISLFIPESEEAEQVGTPEKVVSRTETFTTTLIPVIKDPEYDRRKSRLRNQMPALNGLKALALIFVVFYHLYPTKLIGGYLGVVVFFVLSGYLVTDQLMIRFKLAPREKDLMRFYKRRISRIFFPLLGYIMIISCWVVFFQPEFLQKYTKNALSSLFFVNNFWQISENFSYFDIVNQRNLFKHLWSISIQVQFYIIWGLVIYLVCRLCTKKEKIVMGISLISGAASSLLMLLKWIQTHDADRIYYGTDTRWTPFMVGAILAIVLPTRRIKEAASVWKKTPLNIVGILTLLMAIIFMVFMPVDTAPLYLAGMLLFSCFSAVLIVVCAASNSILHKIFSLPVLQVIGNRNYSIYLWQYSIQVIILTLFKHSKISYHWTVLLQLLLLIFIVLFYYRVFEEKGFYNRYIKTLFKRKSQGLQDEIQQQLYIQEQTSSSKLITIASLAIFGVISLGTVYAGYESVKVTRAFDLLPSETIAEVEATTPAPKVTETKEPIINDVLEQVEIPVMPEREDYGNIYLSEDDWVQFELSEADLRRVSKLEITMVGDSVLQGAKPNLLELMPLAKIDASVSRQFNDLLEILDEKEQSTELTKVIFIALGSNGPFTEESYNSIKDKYSDHTFIFLNTVAPTQWEDNVNNLLYKVTADQQNAYLIDWHDFAKTKKELFATDGVHLKPTAAKIYAKFVAKQLLRILDTK